ncbi:K(+)-transporting ATPase subunit C [Aerosakkonemataceae cyanobacterium BLCC-F154]|uniref:Potassium-transporting ATPase KdpC subunit n=1 Tax=Floridaenema fluviatile BLCC-F154 TaxID=3153640 RepID=A0ABV4YD61_9CYAN
MMREIGRSIRVSLALWVLTAILYPGVMLAVGLLPPLQFQANGSILKNPQGQVIGSALIGQSFTTNRYFLSRPSTVDYSTFTQQEFNPVNPDNIIEKTGTSGASNLAPSNPELIKRVQLQVNNLKQLGVQPTADLVYTSGSGLDPHISLEAAKAQISRVAQVRSLNPNQVEILVNRNVDRRFLGIFGEPGVNLLKLNLALDNLPVTR